MLSAKLKARPYLSRAGTGNANSFILTERGDEPAVSMALAEGERGRPTVLQDSLLHSLLNSGLMACPTTAVSAGAAGETLVSVESLCSASLWVRIAAGSPRDGIALLQQLLEAGHDLFAGDAEGMTCAHHACKHARGWELHFLLAIERGCRERSPAELQGQESLLRMRTRSGESILHIAAAHGHEPVIRYLLTAWAGHELDGADARGRTPMHTAAARGHACVVKLLLRAGASITAEDISGACALRVAVGADTRDLLLLAEHKLGLMRNARPGVVAYFRYV